MAVKIITPGILPEDRVYKTNCRNCDCTFEFQRIDAVLIPADRRGDGDGLRIECPTCSRPVFVDHTRPQNPAEK